jgi:hypothetical protein
MARCQTLRTPYKWQPGGPARVIRMPWELEVDATLAATRVSPSFGMTLPEVNPVKHSQRTRNFGPAMASGPRGLGVSRSKLYELLSDGRIRSICLRSQKGAQRGVRLIDKESIDSFMESHGRLKCSPDSTLSGHSERGLFATAKEDLHMFIRQRSRKLWETRRPEAKPVRQFHDGLNRPRSFVPFRLWH